MVEGIKLYDDIIKTQGNSLYTCKKNSWEMCMPINGSVPSAVSLNVREIKRFNKYLTWKMLRYKNHIIQKEKDQRRNGHAKTKPFHI